MNFGKQFMAVPNAAVYKLAVLATISLFSLAGCGEGENKSKATQVAAKVNGNEISVHQLNALLNSVPNTKPEEAPRVRAELLEKLIDQQLAFEQAQKKKLDRSPDVVMAIEMAKRDIVARAFFTQQLAGLPKVTEDEIHQYYVANNAVLADRRIFDVREVSVEPKVEVLESLQQFAKERKNPQEVTTWLTAKNIQFRTGTATRASEQIGAELLPKIATLQAGDTAFIQGPKNYLLVHIEKVQPAPISEKDAAPRIAQFLQNQRVQKLVAEQTIQLRTAAKIEYLGEFVPVTNTTTGAPAAPAVAPAGTSDSVPTAEQVEKAVDGL